MTGFKNTIRQKVAMIKLRRFFTETGINAILLLAGLSFTQQNFAQGSQPFNTNGTFNLPTGVTSITVEAWGGGAGGNANVYGGGGGGAYSKITISNPNSSYSVVIGTGGAAGANGTNTTFGSVLTANGAIGASGGVASVGTGITSNKGGNGGGGTTNSGGGAGASASGPGANAVGPTGGIGVSPGGSGGNGSATTNGQPGLPYGGGGGSRGTGGGSAAGANGEVIVSWTCPAATISYAASGFCKSATSAIPTINGTTGGTFLAAPAGLTINSSTGEINPSTGTAGTNYTAHYQITGGNGCSAVDATASITVNAIPVSSVSAQSNITCFAANDGTITVSAGNGASPYTFSVDNGTNYLPATGTNLRLFTALLPNTAYRIKVKDNNGCISK